MDTTEQIPADLMPVNLAARLLPGQRPGKSAHVATVYRFIERGRLRAWRVGGRNYVSRAELLQLIQPVQPRRPRPDAEGVQLTRAQADAQTTAILKRLGIER